MIFDRILGALAIAAFSLMVWYGHRNPHVSDDYLELKAQFAAIDGLKLDAEVNMYGQRIGYVSDIRFVDNSLIPVISVRVSPDAQIPIDSLLVLRSDALFGEKRAEIRPGALLDYMQIGDNFLITDGGINIEVVLDSQISFVEERPFVNKASSSVITQ